MNEQEQLATLIRNIYGHVDGDRTLLKAPFQVGIIFALGALVTSYADLHVNDENFNVEEWFELTGFNRARNSIGVNVKDQ